MNEGDCERAPLVRRRGWRRFRRHHGAIVFVSISTSLLVSSARLVLFIREYAENFLYADQWEYWPVMGLNLDPLSLFRYQLGPHRMGLGLLLLTPFAGLTRWDGRVEPYQGGAALIISAALAIALKRRIIGRYELTDVVIPVLMLTVLQHELLVLLPMPEVSFFPLVLLLLTALLTTVTDIRLRYPGLVITNVASIYTGYAVFVGLITPLIIVTDPATSRSETRWKSIALLLAFAGTASFFVGYRFAMASACPVPHSQPLEYVQLLALLYNSPFGLPFLNPTAYGVLVGLLALGAWTIQRSLRAQYRLQFVPLALLFAYTFLAAISIAIGRVCFGPTIGQLPRYITYLLPTWLGLYMLLCRLPRQWLKIGLTAAFAVLAVLILSFRSTRIGPSLVIATEKTAWKVCYLQSEDAAGCDEQVGFKPVPYLSSSRELEPMLTLFKERRLNLFNAG
jgi:hypothetical protein